MGKSDTMLRQKFLKLQQDHYLWPIERLIIFLCHDISNKRTHSSKLTPMLLVTSELKDANSRNDH